jgi:hypothetical protein
MGVSYVSEPIHSKSILDLLELVLSRTKHKLKEWFLVFSFSLYVFSILLVFGFYLDYPKLH